MPYQNLPVRVQETAGTKFYCTCGESNNKPYCDGNHSKKNTGKEPIRYEIPEARMCSICDCGESKNAPFCDGSHSKKG